MADGKKAASAQGGGGGGGRSLGSLGRQTSSDGSSGSHKLTSSNRESGIYRSTNSEPDATGRGGFGAEVPESIAESSWRAGGRSGPSPDSKVARLRGPVKLEKKLKAVGGGMLRSSGGGFYHEDGSEI